MLKDLWYVLTGRLKREYLEYTQAMVTEQLESIDRLVPRVDSLIIAYNTLALANARLIAKLDPLYGIPEDDPARKAASDELGKAIIAKLKAEDVARRETTR